MEVIANKGDRITSIVTDIPREMSKKVQKKRKLDNWDDLAQKKTSFRNDLDRKSNKRIKMTE